MDLLVFVLLLIILLALVGGFWVSKLIWIIILVALVVLIVNLVGRHRNLP